MTRAKRERRERTDNWKLIQQWCRVPEQRLYESIRAITLYGYSRDHREDLKQWMLALATTHDGDIPVFLQPLDGN